MATAIVGTQARGGAVLGWRARAHLRIHILHPLAAPAGAMRARRSAAGAARTFWLQDVGAAEV
jgi:hypothetical protein